jgi:hypothetical protein
MSVRLAVELEQAVNEAREALETPLEVSARRLHSLKQLTHDVEQTSSDLGLLLAAEQQTVTRKVNGDARAWLESARGRAQRDLQRIVRDLAVQGRAHLRRHALSASARVARRIVRGELQAVERTAAQAYKDSTSRFVQLANAHLEALAAIEPRLAELPTIDLAADLSERRRFFFTDMMALTARTPGQVIGDLVSSSDRYRSRVLTRATDYLTRLLETNTGGVVNDLDERLVESRRRLEAELRSRLNTLAESVDRAIARACDTRSAGARAVALERERLARLSIHLGSLRARSQAAAEVR